MIVPMLDLKAQYASMKEEIDRAISEVMEAQHFILGRWVEECEKAIAEYCRCAHAVGVSSGTDALLICLMAEGIGPGDEVITSPYTFFATAGVIARVGARPVFVDIDPATYNLDPALISSKITPKTRAIIPVHLFGQMAEMDAIGEVARKHDIIVIEDAAQAIGAEHNHHRAGSVGKYGCLSFFPSKNLGAAGDGGMVVTNDGTRAEKLMCLRAHGSKPKYHHKMIGGNFRLDTLQAAIVSAKFAHLDAWTTARQRNAERYLHLFEEAGLHLEDDRQFAADSSAADDERQIALPIISTNRHIFNQYIIRVPQRDRLRIYLNTQGVATEVYYPVPMHLQECFSYLGYSRGEFSESEKAAQHTLALPIYPELSEAQAHYVVHCIKEFFSSGT